MGQSIHVMGVWKLKLFRNITVIFVATGLGACTTTTTTPPAPAVNPIGSAQVDVTGSYSVTQNGTTRTLGVPFGYSIGTDFASLRDATFEAVGYQTADVTAVAGIDIATPYATFAGISGTASTTVPTTGAGAYAGGFSVNYYRGGTINGAWGSEGLFTVSVDFAAKTLSGSGSGSSGGNLAVAGTLTGSQFNGTANFTALDFAGASDVPMAGGLYGANTVAGILQNSQISGAFYAK